MARSTVCLDRAILKYRNDPTEANRVALLAEQRRYVKQTFVDNADEYIMRTRQGLTS